MDTWRKYGKLSLLGKIHPKDISGFPNKVYPLSPGEIAVRRKNGITELPVTDTGLLKIMSFWEMIQSIFLKDRIQAYVLNSTPFDVDMHIIGENSREGSVETEGDASERGLVEQYIVAGKLQSLDSQIVGASIRIQAQIDPEKINQFLSFFIRGRNHVLTSDVWAGIDQLIMMEIFSPIVEENAYKEMKGNKNIKSLIAEEGEKKLKTYLNTNGLIMSKIFFRWHASKNEFYSETGINPEDPDVIKFQIDGEEFEFTFGQFFLWIGIIFVAFIAVLVFIFS
tara:strand:+ start:300 stop:1142 length:843 start_codon:yes stop_codon:yes gene_type:complete